MNTLFISDLDGTFLDPKGELTPFAADTINALTAAGANFTFATARSVYSAKPLMSPADIRIPCLLMNGVSLYDLRSERCISNEFIPVSASAEILRAFEKHGVHCFMYRIDHDVLICYYSALTTKVMQSFAESRKKQYLKPFVQLERLADMADHSVVYFTTTGPYEELLPLKNEIEHISGISLAFYLDVYNGAWYLEIFSEKASKSNGIGKLRKLYGFDRVVAFGDNLNDLPMFEVSDVRIAVENARPEVKAAADIVVPPNSEDGAAKWLAENYRRYTE